MDATETLTMEQLFDEAEKNGLWFYTSYQDLWFSPNELRSQQADGRFQWGVENWQLRNPQEGLETMKRVVERAEREYESFKRRLGVQ